MYSKTKHKHKNPQRDILGVIQQMLKNRVVKRILFSVSLLKINIHFNKQHSQKEFSSSTTGVKVPPSFKVLFPSLQSFKHYINYHIGVRGYTFAFMKNVNILNFSNALEPFQAFVMKNQWLQQFFFIDSVVFSIRLPQTLAFGIGVGLHLKWLSLPCSRFQPAVPGLGFGGLWHMSRQWCSLSVSRGNSRA